MKQRLDAGELGTPLVATAEVKWFGLVTTTRRHDGAARGHSTAAAR
jgi:hypothetical protein